jgi:GntR family transcriptional repressor for pyruvate dehydrogenase complex
MGNVIKPISRVSLAEQVASQLASMISAGHWKPGEKLPPEAQLCKAFHVGRSSLREALKSLAFVGFVQMQPGEGTFVTGEFSQALKIILAHGLLLTEKDFNDVWETRVVVETELAGLCAERATEEDLQTLRRLLEGMPRSIQQSARDFMQLDLDFHLTIAACSQNEMLRQLVRTTREILQEVIAKGLQLPGGPERAYPEHVTIFNAIAERNSQKARRAMRNHLQRSQRAFRVLFDTAISGHETAQREMPAGTPAAAISLAKAD